MIRSHTLNFKQTILVCLMVAMGGLFPLSSHAQSTSKRLDIIEKQLKAVQRKVFKPGSAFPQSSSGPQTSSGPEAIAAEGSNLKLADIEARLAQMETQLRQLTGRIEEGNFQTDKLQQQMKAMARDYEFRLSELEKTGSSPAIPKVETTNKKNSNHEPKVSLLPAGSEKSQYSYAQKLVTKGQYVKAEAALGEFLKRYPKSKLAGNAQYWLGQTYYVRKMYTKSTRAFLEGYNNYPKSPKAPAFLLKIGMSLVALGEKTDACDAYAELASRYPDSIESKNKRPALEKKAGCK